MVMNIIAQNTPFSIPRWRNFRLSSFYVFWSNYQHYWSAADVVIESAKIINITSYIYVVCIAYVILYDTFLAICSNIYLIYCGNLGINDNNYILSWVLPLYIFLISFNLVISLVPSPFLITYSLLFFYFILLCVAYLFFFTFTNLISYHFLKYHDKKSISLNIGIYPLNA